MAKSVLKKKKTNRRLKRSVRRTLGGLCMITAIIVAAIPFPDAAAADPTEGGISVLADGASEVPAYPTSVEGIDIDTVNITGDTYTAYTVSKPSSGDWSLDWQFKYMAASEGADGYITEYNHQYEVYEIKLEHVVYRDYITIGEDYVSNFYSGENEILDDKGNSTGKIRVDVLSGDDKLFDNPKEVPTLTFRYVFNGDNYINNDGALDFNTSYDKKVEDFFAENFPKDYADYKTNYANWYTYKDTDQASKYPEPAILDKTYKDVYKTDKERVQFFCEKVFGDGTNMELVSVDMREYAQDGSNKWLDVYIPKVAASETDDEGSKITIDGIAYRVDGNNFLTKSHGTICGIAPGAFKGVSNVNTLEMAKEISYIGDSAFENSFVQSVILPMDSKIGNYAFKNCSLLTSVTMPTGVQKIGSEAFYGTSIRNVSIPSTINEIGVGAFANCGLLESVTFEGESSTEKTVGKYCFYDCFALSNVNFGKSRVTAIGDAAFAVSKTIAGGIINFKFPDYITTEEGMGDYLFAGRSSLQNVTMPTDFGMSSDVDLKSNIFLGCYNLASVIFPDSAALVSYPENLFRDVVNEQFYVCGPKSTPRGSDAKPRQSTWKAYFAGEEKKQVPYVYKENGHDFYEVGSGIYRCVIDEKGMLVSCTFINGADDIETFTIPDTVGTTTITGIADGCLGDGTKDDSVLGRILNLVVKDGNKITTIDEAAFANAKKLKTITLGDSVTSIGASAFKGCPELTTVSIGSGVTSIGASAFENCPKIETIKFDNPAGGAESFPLSNIGENAFSIGNYDKDNDGKNDSKLTIHGLIHGSYGPFAWAMQPNNYMDPKTGLRVCYKSAENDPQAMTVILDNSNNLPTLVDYPKYNDENIQKILENTNDITPEEAAILDAATNIVVPDGVKSIDTVGYFNSESKDINGNDPIYKSNDTNIETYFSGLSGIRAENKYGLFIGAEKGDDSITAVGPNPTAFEKLYKAPVADSGLEDDTYTEDLLDYETIGAGNDHIESIVLTSVEYLPENCFFSCEKLETVDLGSAMKEMDALPFLGCNNITSMACESGVYSCNNGILYKNLEDGTKEIVECLPGRGDVVGSTTVSVANDPDLANVSAIADEAFSYCPNINKVILDGASNIIKIPERCFVGAEGLNEVDLPANVKLLDEDAFSTGGDYLEVIVRGREVALIEPTFQGVKSPYLITYEDAAIRQAAKEQKVNVETTLDEMLQVRFFMPDGATLIDTQFIEMNGNAKKMAPDADELREQGYITADQDLYGWSGQEDITNITQSCFFIAKIGLRNGTDSDGDGIPDTPNDDGTGGDGTGGSGNGSGNGNGSGSGSGSDSSNKDKDDDDDDDNDKTTKYTLTVVYGDGSGVYAAGTKVIISAIEPPAGKEFYKWTTNNTGVTITSATSAATTVKTTNSDATVTATYRDKGTVSSNTVNRKSIGSSGTTVQITKPGISNTDKAYASVSGSTDNFIVKITESSEAANAVATALSNKYSDMNPIKYFAMDISLYDKNGNKVTNTNGLSVNITMPIPDALVQYGGNNKVGAVVNGNTLEDLGCKFTTVDGIPCITFTATHFSPYTIYVDTSNLSVNTLDSTPKTGDGIHPKWFVSIALACISLILFLKKDKVTAPKKVTV